MKETLVTFGKFKGQRFTDIPREYAEWLKCQGNYKFYLQWLTESRLSLHTHFILGTSKDGRWLERKLPDGNYIFFITKYKDSPKRLIDTGRIYYLVDKDGNYVKDFKTFGDPRIKQGCVDEDFSDWVTLFPSGITIKGKMMVSPYWEHFQYETYQIKAA
jgi:uncharacterized protein (DUF3820 family)